MTVFRSDSRVTQFSVFTVLLSLLSVVSAFLLLYLSQFAELGVPPTQLQAEVVFFLGVLFTGFLFPFVSRLPEKQAWLASLVTFALSVLFSLLFQSMSIVSPVDSEQMLNGSLMYALAPATALILANLVRRFFAVKAELWVAMLVYVVCTILANYTLDAFIPLGLGEFAAKINVGTLFFGIIFTQRDRIHAFGRRYAYLTIALAAFANVAIALRLDTPLRFVIVSFVAIVVSELTDTEVYQRVIKRRWFTRVAVSNAFSVPVDSFIFTVFAFWGEAFATPTWMTEVILTDIVIKFLIGLIVAVQVFKLKETSSSAVQL